MTGIGEKRIRSLSGSGGGGFIFNRHQTIVLEFVHGNGGGLFRKLDEPEIGLLIDETRFLRGHDHRPERGDVFGVTGLKGKMLVLRH